MEELQQKTRELIAAWGFGSNERWNAEFDLGLISFSDPGRIVHAPMQVIGTYNGEEGTWFWSWDHPSIPADLAKHAGLVRDFGVKYGLRQYLSRKISCTEDDARQFTALACHLAGAAGAYRGPSEPLYVFMTFGDVTIERVDGLN